METGMVFVLALCYINVFCEVGNCHYRGWHELFVQFHEILSCEISLNINFKPLDPRLPFPDSVGGIFPGPATTQKVYQGIG